MAARICPQCRTRVDERRAKASPYCLSCGAPLGSSFGHKPVAKSPLPWILGGVGAFLVLAFGGCGLFLFAASGAKPDTPGPTGAENLTNGPNVETPTAQPTVTAAPTGKATGTGRVPIVATAPPKVVVAFPRAQANSELDRVTAGVASCKRAGDPTGGGSVRVDFEPDGRVGVVLAKPFAGTVEGSCISGRYLGIRVGAFQGPAQSITRTFSIAGASNNPGF